MCCEKKKEKGPSCSYTKQESYTGHNERVTYWFSFSPKILPIFIFFIIVISLSAIWVTRGQLGPLSRRQPHEPYVVRLRYVNYRPEDHREPRNEVRSLSLAECLGGFDSSDSFTIPQPFRPLSPCNTYLK